MRRREFVTLFGSAAVWPLAARAQQAAMPIVGLVALSPGPLRQQVAAFREGLRELAYVEGQNVAIEYRYAEGQTIDSRRCCGSGPPSSGRVRWGGTGAALIAKQASMTIPIVFSVGEDPVAAGLVDSLNQPAGNMTGEVSIQPALKRSG